MSDDDVCINCAILKSESDRKKCGELTKELAKGTIDMETFSNAFIGEISGNKIEKSDKLLSVFCDPRKAKEEIKHDNKSRVL